MIRMRMKRTLWLLGIGLVIAGYVAATSAVKGELESRLSHTIGRKVTIQSVHLTLPVGVYLTGISAAPDSIQQLWIRWSMLSWLKGTSGIDLELTALKLFLERDPRGVLTPPLPAAASGSRTTAFWPAVAGKGMAVWPARLRIRDGALTFTDRKVTPEISWRVRDLRVSFKAGPRIGGFTISAVGLLEDESKQSIGRFQIDGEFLRDQAAEFTLFVRHEALASLAPSIQPVLGTAPHQGRCEMKAKILVYQGLVVAETDWTAVGVAFPTEEPTLLGPSGNRLGELLKDSNGQIHLSFVVKGRAGETLDWSDKMASALQEALQQALVRSIQGALTDAEVNKPVEELIRKGFESLGR